MRFTPRFQNNTDNLIIGIALMAVSVVGGLAGIDHEGVLVVTLCTTAFVVAAIWLLLALTGRADLADEPPAPPASPAKRHSGMKGTAGDIFAAARSRRRARAEGRAFAEGIASVDRPSPFADRAALGLSPLPSDPNAEALRVLKILDDTSREMAIWVAEQRERPLAEREHGSPGYVADYIRAWRMRFQYGLEQLANDLRKDDDLKQIADFIQHASRAADIEQFEQAVVTLRSMAQAIRQDRNL
jgi:hypothetical protein